MVELDSQSRRIKELDVELTAMTSQRVPARYEVQRGSGLKLTVELTAELEEAKATRGRSVQERPAWLGS